MSTKYLTDKEKLDEIKTIITSNLFPIFTSFALELESENKDDKRLEKYTRLKELLDISHGIDKNSAIEYDKFKKDNIKLYDIVLERLHSRLMFLAKDDSYFQNLSSHTFKIAVILTSFNLSSEIKAVDFQNLLLDIDETFFNLG